MIIPWQQLSADALNGIIEDFVMREGTDYGTEELSFDRKKQDILRQLKNEEVVVVYSELYETVNLMLASEFNGDQ
ncbi:MAG: YheU family protein [Gammaproteobacteria bacterium]|nr:YheU family protein [Gammaproteobacteria bacterium]